MAGCVGSAAALLGDRRDRPLGAAGRCCRWSWLLGFFNGVFAVAAIGAMMALAGEGAGAREGTRMGLWGAAQAIAAGFRRAARRGLGRCAAPHAAR